MNRPGCLGLSILLIFEFCYDYVKLKYNGNTKSCYMDTDNFIVYIKTDKQMILITILQKIMILDLIIHIMK